MHMIRHYHEIGQLVTIAIKMLQTVSHDLGTVGIPQDASTIAVIKCVILAVGKVLEKFSLDLPAKLIQMAFPVSELRIDSMSH